MSIHTALWHPEQTAVDSTFVPTLLSTFETSNIATFFATLFAAKRSTFFATQSQPFVTPNIAAAC